MSDGASMLDTVLVMPTTTGPATEADLLQAPDDGRKYELVDGEIRVSPTGFRHGRVSLEIAARLLAYAQQHKLGHVADSSTGFRLPSGNVRSPDASFVAAGRFEGERLPDDFASLAPQATSTGRWTFGSDGFARRRYRSGFSGERWGSGLDPALIAPAIASKKAFAIRS